MTPLFYILLFIFLLTAVILCFSILVQEAKSLGLGASFGGDSGDSLFGTSTAQVLKRFTAYVSGVFLVCCFLLSVWTSSLANRKLVLPDMPPVAPPAVETPASSPAPNP